MFALITVDCVVFLFSDSHFVVYCVFFNLIFDIYNLLVWLNICVDLNLMLFF